MVHGPWSMVYGLWFMVEGWGCIVPARKNYYTETCSGYEAGSYLRLLDFAYHSTLGLRVIKKKKSTQELQPITETYAAVARVPAMSF